MPCRHTGGVDVRLYSFLTLALDGVVWVVNATPQLLYPRERGRLHIVQVAAWGPRIGLSRYGEEIISCVNRVRNPSHTARIRSLYRLSC